MTTDNSDPPQATGTISTTMTVLAWVALMVFAGFFFDELLDRQQNPNQSLSTEYSKGRVREVSLLRNNYGHYVTNGKLNGHSVVFMLDTGATGVAIPGRLARKLNLKAGRPYPTQTANGVTTAYTVRLDSVSVGDIELKNVSAAIVPGYEGDEILLGMSFLQHIEFTQRGDTLVLRQVY